MSNFNPFQAPMNLGSGGGDRFVDFALGAAPVASLRDGTMVKFQCGAGHVAAYVGGVEVARASIANGVIKAMHCDARYEAKGLADLIRRSAAMSPTFPFGQPDGHDARVKNYLRPQR